MGKKQTQERFIKAVIGTSMENLSQSEAGALESSCFHISQEKKLSKDKRGNESHHFCSHRSHRQSIGFGDLPDDVIYTILQYLAPSQLCTLRRVSRRLLFLASKDVVWLSHAKECGILKGYIGQCSAMDVCRVATHWKNGYFKQVFIAKQKKRQIPWLCKSDDSLWLSKSSCIRCFHCESSGRLVEDKVHCLQAGNEDLTRFVVKDNIVVSGCSDGSVCMWNTSESGSHLMFSHQVHKSETHCVDFTDSLIVSGSRDTTCKVLHLEKSSKTPDNVVLQTFKSRERVWSLKISPTKNMFAAGLAGCLDDPPIVLWDLESGNCLAELSMNHKRGAGVLDIRFESPNEMLTCGYDTFIRLWDLRTHTCVQQWEEPFDSALYCIDTDGENTMIVGTAHNAMVRLWDKRHSEPVQMMYCRNSHSPVYSVAMDYGHLYIALDTGLTVMDFT